jgi:hypothetical protein
MNLIIIRAKRLGKSIAEDLKMIGFVQVNVISFCIDKSIVMIHQDFGTKDSIDLVVSTEKEAERIIDILKKNGMYISHHVAQNDATDRFMKIEGKRCDLVGVNI